MLSDKIWITRKTRINTEQRLQENSNITQALMVTYSLALVSLSIWNLSGNSQKINLISAFASIVVLVLSVYLTAQKYSERSIAMRNCYIKLDELYSKVKHAEVNNDDRALSYLESEYTSLLLNIENHSEFDFLRLRFTLRDNKDTTLPPFTRKDYCDYIWGLVLRWFIIIVAFVISFPLIVIVWL